jgi:signal transduction histidine kinase
MARLSLLNAARYLTVTLALTLSPARLAAQPIQPTPPATALTAQESAWIAAHPVIRVGLDVLFPPYAMADQTGIVLGIDPTFLELIARRTGLRFEIVHGATWEQMQEDFRAGKVDMLMNLSLTDEREGYMNFTEVYNHAPCAIVTRSDTPYILDASQLNGVKVGLPRGYVGLKLILADFAPAAKLVEYNDSTAALNAVANGEIVAVLADIVNAAYLVKSQRLANLRLGSILPGFTGVYIGVRKEFGPLPGILNKAVADITPIERRQMIDRWIGLDFSDHWWLKAFKVAVAIAAVALMVFVVLFLRARRLESELAQRRIIQAKLEATHADLEAAHAELARASEEKTEMMHSVAHDLRNPITGFMLSGEMLQLEIEPTNHTALQTVTALREASKKMLAMVDELVDVHMLESGRRKMKWKPVDLVDLSRRARAEMNEAACRKDIRIDLHSELPALPLSSDESALRHVVDNLLSNAIKFSPRRSTIVLDLRSETPGYCLRVIDQGPGVKPEEREAIFEKYSIGSTPPSGGEKSTGLGLWIVRRTVQDLHGKVWCEPGPGSVGSAFVVCLPLNPPAGAVTI